jgi:hypothetical protein
MGLAGVTSNGEVQTCSSANVVLSALDARSPGVWFFAINPSQIQLARPLLGSMAEWPISAIFRGHEAHLICRSPSN